MAVLKAYGSMGSTLLKGVLAPIKEKGDEVEFEPIGMAARKKARCSSLDSFGEVPSVEEDGDFNLPDSNLKHEKLTGPFHVKAQNILWPTVVAAPVPVLACSIVMNMLEKAVLVPKPYPSCVSSVDSLQRHGEAKYCCFFGLRKCKGVDSFEHSCVDVHACYKGTLPWLAPRGPRISKLSRTDTAAAAPAPSRPFSFRASLTVSLSVVFE